MNPRIICFKLGLTSCYLIIGEEIVMVDSGMPNKLQQFKKILSENTFLKGYFVRIFGTWETFSGRGN